MNHIDVTRHEQCLHIRLTGEFASNAARDIDAALAAVSGSPTLVLDLSGTTFLGGVGTSYLVKLQTRLSTLGGGLFLNNVSESVASELAMRDLTGFFRIAEEWEEDMGEEMLPLLAAR
jgi:anti-anti-sigma factor